MRIGNVVNTPHGIGVIVDIENHKYAKRYGVRLKDRSIRYYFEKEISKWRPEVK